MKHVIYAVCLSCAVAVYAALRVAGRWDDWEEEKE